MTGADNVTVFLGLAIGLLVGMVGHEYAHARTADYFGDKTARLHGRLTLNPKAHVDPLGTLILPAIFLFPVLVGSSVFGGVIFGWAKPVPVSPHRMRHPRSDGMWTALAGPATNFALAALAGLAIRAGASGRVAQVLFFALTANVFLGIINALPIPPLDGSKVLARALSPQAAFKMEELGQYGLLFLILLFLFFQDPLVRLADGVIRGLVS